MKMKEVTVKYGIFDVYRYGGEVNCVVVYNDKTLHFSTDVDEDAYRIAEIAEGSDEWSCKGKTFARVIKRLNEQAKAKREDVEVDGSYATGTFSFATDADRNGGYGIKFTARCGETCFVELKQLNEIVKKFGLEPPEKQPAAAAASA